jgi:hypothetical protein
VVVTGAVAEAAHSETYTLTAGLHDEALPRGHALRRRRRRRRRRQRRRRPRPAEQVRQQLPSLPNHPPFDAYGISRPRYWQPQLGMADVHRDRSRRRPQPADATGSGRAPLDVQRLSRTSSGRLSQVSCVRAGTPSALHSRIDSPEFGASSGHGQIDSSWGCSGWSALGEVKRAGELVVAPTLVVVPMPVRYR